MLTSAASMAGTPGSGFLSSRAWNAAAIWISLPLICGLAKAIFRSLSMLGRSREEVRSKIDPALKFFGGATGDIWTMRPFLSARMTRSSSGVPADLAALAAKRDVADAGQVDARSGDRTGDVGIDERHLGRMGRAGDGFLDIGIPAGVRRFEAGDKARHVLVGDDGRKADPDAETDDERRQKATFFLTGGGNKPLQHTSMHGTLSRNATDPTGEQNDALTLMGR